MSKGKFSPDMERALEDARLNRLDPEGAMQRLRAEDQRKRKLRTEGEALIKQAVDRVRWSEEQHRAINYVINRSFHATPNAI